MPDDCASCPTRECELASVDEGLGCCRFGFNFIRISPEVLAFGFLVAGEPGQHKRHRKQLRKHGRHAIWPEQLDQLEQAHGSHMQSRAAAEEATLLEVEKETLLDDAAQGELVRRLEPDIRRAAGQLHDYIDLAAQILKQLNVYIGVTYPDIQVPDNLDSAPDELQSIYWLARLMEEKISAFGYYLNPETIRSETQTFRLHGLVTKYRRMYQRSCQQKGVGVSVGEDYSRVVGNSEALGVVVHSLIDNAVKYAPPDSTIRIDFAPSGSSSLELSVTSLGPRIGPGEETRIFMPFVRGNAAQGTEVEGMGFGLAFAQRIAAKYGEEVRVRQSSSPSRVDGYYETEFTYRFSRADG